MCYQPAVAHASTQTLSLCADETRVFFDILTHDDHNSNYILARSDGNRWTERSVRAGSYESLAFRDKASYYLTRNGFTGKKRLATRTRQINALMYDIDCHGEGSASVLPDLTAAFYEAFSRDVLPEPSLFVFTGRGLHLYYVLEKATPYLVKGGNVNERGLAYVHDVEARLAKRIQTVVSPFPEAELDTSVFDYSRVARIPGSWNAKAGVACTLLSYSTDYYTLPVLARYGDALPSAKKSAPRRGRVVRFDRLMSARLRKVEQLQAHRHYDCQGSRENMCFVFYNTATQIYGPDMAYEMTTAFNSRFVNPLPESDIDAIKKTVDSVVIAYGSHKGETGFYPLSADNLSSKLNMSSAEASEIGFFASKRIEDRLAAKETTRRRKQHRDQEILRLYTKEGLTQKQIVLALSGTPEQCSLRTVASVVAKYHASRAKKEALKVAAAKALAKRASDSSACKDAKIWHTGCSVVGTIGLSSFVSVRTFRLLSIRDSQRSYPDQFSPIGSTALQ